MDALFAFLFKYRPVLFREGDVVLGAAWPGALALALGAVLAALALATYAWRRGRAGRRERLLLAGLRSSALALLILCLLRPTLVLSSVVPQRNFLGVLVDDSRSMALPDADGAPRSDFVAAELGADGELLERLRERFNVRIFRFDADAERVAGVEEMRWDGTRTDLPTALDRAREELSSVPLSGLVVVSDGADNVGRTLAEALVPLQAASVPVYTVGLGEEALRPDLQLGRIEAPRRVLKGTSLVVDVLVAQRGLGGRSVTLVVEDDTRILAEEQVELSGDGEPTVVPVRFTLDEPGPQRVRFRVPVQEGERVERNNERSLLVDVGGQREKILYFEGEPRYEVKFLRRAVRADDNLQVVVLQRTAENKFLRLDVDTGEELAGGFPDTREELFQYRGLILGSVEASFFTHDQLEMIEEFVGRRGGGLLALGGRLAFSEGGWAGTAVAEALPVVLGRPAPDPRAAFTEVAVRPTVAGRSHPATQIRAGGAGEADSWDSLPPLSTMNRIVEAKPGATVLLTGRAVADSAGADEERIVLAHHRYGRGKALALPVQDSWIWQMHHEVPPDDLSHETFWRQLLRWLVDGVPERVELRPDREQAEAGERVRLVAEVRDSSHLALNDAQVVARVRPPGGEPREVALPWTVERDGAYEGTFVPDADGDWEIQVVATRADGEAVDTVGADVAWVRVGPADDEFFDAGQRRAVLERLAEETGGRYYTAASARNLPEDLQYTGAGVTLTEERDLWDMPVIFLLLVGLLGVEWGLRRKWGLV